MKRINLFLFLGVCFILLSLAAWLSSLWAYFSADPKQPFQIMATLGDSIGGTTAPFLNIAGFLMLYAAFRQQNQAMLTGRQEFGLQRFESTFFQLLQLHFQNINNIRTQFDKKTHLDFFEHARAFLSQYDTQSTDRTQVAHTYQQLYKEQAHLLDHFVRHLFFLLQTIQLSRAFEHQSPEQQARERKQYADIVWNELSPNETMVLFYHLLFAPQGVNQGYWKLLHQYAWFSQAEPPNWLIHPAHWEWLKPQLQTD